MWTIVPKMQVCMCSVFGWLPLCFETLAWLCDFKCAFSCRLFLFVVSFFLYVLFAAYHILVLCYVFVLLLIFCNIFVIVALSFLFGLMVLV